MADTLFPTTPATLNFSAADRAAIGISDTAATKRLAQLDASVAALSQQLTRATEMMLAHKSVFDGALSAGQALIAEAAALGYSPSRPLRDWDYIYNAANLVASDFFPWVTGGGQFTGNPAQHPAITFTLTGDPAADPPVTPTGEIGHYQTAIAAATAAEEFGNSISEPISINLSFIRAALTAHNALPTALQDPGYRTATQTTLNNWSQNNPAATTAALMLTQLDGRRTQITTRAAALNTAIAAVLTEYNLMLPVLLKLSEGSCVKVRSLQKSVAQLQEDRAHAVLLKDLSDKAGATSLATGAPALWGDDAQSTSWQDVTNPDDL